MGILSRSLNRNTFQKRTKVVWSCVLIAILIICSYIGIFHSHRYFGFDIVLVIGIVGMLSIYGLDLIWFEHGKWHKLKLFLFVLLIGGPITAVVLYLHNVYRDNMLAGRTVVAEGIVTALYVKRSKNNRVPYAVFSYKVKGKTWTQDLINSAHPVEVGDTIKLVCSELDPEVCLRIENNAPSSFDRL